MKKIKFVAVAMLLVALSSFSLIKKSGYQVGDVVDDFSLKNVTDKNVSLEQFKDAKGFILIFTCNHCPFSVAYEDRIIALDKKYKKVGYPVIAINPNNPEKQPADSFDLMKVRAKEKDFSFPYLFDEGQHVTNKYGASKTPEVYVLEKTKKGNVIQYTGAIDDNHEDADAVKKKYVEDAIDLLLKNKKVIVTETKAIGCSVKR